MGDEITVVVDTREQAPWSFEVPTVRATLATGDYSVVGLEASVAIERKSLSDLVGSLTWERERFIREVDRLRAFRWRAVIVEGAFEDLTRKAYRGNATPQSLVASVLAITVDREVPVIFATNREHAAWCCEWLLKRAWKKRAELGEGAAA